MSLVILNQTRITTACF